MRGFFAALRMTIIFSYATTIIFYLCGICKAALKKPYAVVEELFHGTHKSDMEAGAIP